MEYALVEKLGLSKDSQETINLAVRKNKLTLLAKTRNEDEWESLKFLSSKCGLGIKRSFELNRKDLEKFPPRIIHAYQAIPIPLPLEKDKEDKNRIHLVTLWPPTDEMSAWVRVVSGKHPIWYLSRSKEVIECITQNFGIGADSLSESDISVENKETDIEEAEDENAAIIRFVNEIISKAVQDRSTDIHFEPLKNSLQIRYRIDGELVPIKVPQNLIRFQNAIISRLKIMAKLNISEKRRPQDGRITYKSNGNELDIRISTIPTSFGESVSLRLLNQQSQMVSMEDLGMLPHTRSIIEKTLNLPYGIILVTGPTGSGKSTSLSAFIRKINIPERRIITAEDPVEYEIEGVNQTQVHNEIGYTFASALRHILRQDPDVIMVGEMRDRETADIGIRAALTGHLVLSTLHTNDAPGAVTRLIDMDIEPFLVASALELIIAQRLVRRLCSNCRKESTISLTERREIFHHLLEREPTDEDLHTPIYEACGCEKCRGLGYKGRIGLFETLRVNDTIHELIVQKSTAGHIRKIAQQNGMITLQESGWQQILKGQTTLNEVMRFSNDS